MNKLILTLILSIFLISFASAEVQTLGVFKKGECINLIQLCSNCTYNNISAVLYPNSSSASLNLAMTKADTKYNATFCNTNASGQYIVNGYGDVDAVKTAWSYDFEVNPQGIESTISRTETITRSVYFMFGIGIILFIGFLFTKDKVPVKWTFFIVSIIFFLIGLNLLFAGMQDEVINPRLESFFDSFTAISFIFYWFCAGLLIIIWTLSFLSTVLYKQNMDKLRKFGGEMNE